MQETWVRLLGWEDPLEKGIVTHSSILAWRISLTKEPGRQQSMELQRAGHDWATNTHTHARTHTHTHTHTHSHHCHESSFSGWLLSLCLGPQPKQAGSRTPVQPNAAWRSHSSSLRCERKECLVVNDLEAFAIACYMTKFVSSWLIHWKWT